MRISCVVSLFFLVSAPLCFGQANAAEKNELVLTLKVLTKHYCKADHGTPSLIFGLKVDLVNNTAAGVELHLPISAVTVISRSLADVKNRKHELEMHGPDMWSGGPSHSAMPENQSATLLPGKSLQAEIKTFPIPVRLRPQSDSLALNPGRHYLQIQIDVFPPNVKTSRARLRGKEGAFNPNADLCGQKSNTSL